MMRTVSSARLLESRSSTVTFVPIVNLCCLRTYHKEDRPIHVRDIEMMMCKSGAFGETFMDTTSGDPSTILESRGRE